MASKSANALLLLLAMGGPASINGFTSNKRTSFVTTPFSSSRAPPSSLSSSSSLKMSSSDLSEFDHILGEGTTSTSSYAQRRQSLLRVPDSSPAVVNKKAKAVMVSSIAATDEDLDDLLDLDEDTTTEGSTAVEPSTFGDPRLSQYMEQQSSATAAAAPSKFKIPNPIEYAKGKDFSVVLVTIIAPALLLFYGSKNLFTFASSKVDEKSDTILDSYAAEMVYHDGNFDEMKLCHGEYKGKLSYLGPSRNDAMIKRFLELYAKKKIVSPQAISTISYVFSIYKLSEEKAAKTLVELCLSMPEKIASAGKLLFIGTRVLKTKEAKKALQPIKEMLASSYRDEASGPMIVDMAQKAMGEAAYRETVNAAGKKQSSLTPGWEILGLDKETATTIFEEAKKDKFVSSREAHYGSQSAKYDEKGRKLGKDGKPTNPEERAAAEKEERDAVNNAGDGDSVGSAYECGNCGYTIMIAAGREHKFFGPGFKCPECGADKDQFSPPEGMDE